MPRPALGTNVNIHKLKTPYRSYKYSATFKEDGKLNLEKQQEGGRGTPFVTGSHLTT
jgi:hypothetical protein